MTGRGILDADMATLGQWARAGWRWWRDEMAALVPTRWRAQPPRVAWDGAADLADLPARAALELPADAALTRRIETPLMSRQELDGMIALEARRLMPLAGEGAVLAARIAARQADRARMTVDLASLAPAQVEDLATALATAPVRPAAVLAPLPDKSGAIDLLPALTRAGVLPAAGRATAIAWIAVAFLFALNLGVLVWRDSASVDALQAMVDDQRGGTAIAARVIARMRAQDAVVADLAAARRTREPLALMGRLAGALPRGTWLRRFSLSGDTLRLTGMHPHGADIAGALRHAGFAVVRYGDSGEAPTPLGEPFDATIAIAGHR